jgi:membrane protein implicated in regulation of membrane protease activity
MNRPEWSRYAVVKYVLLQLPGLVILVLVLILLRRLIYFPAWAVWLIISIWVIKDAIMFPFVWRAYDKDNPESMIGIQGTVVDRLSPSGYIRIRGELWRARAIAEHASLEKDEVVTVQAVDGLTLLVQPDKVNDQA